MSCTCACFVCYTLLRVCCACLDPLLIDLNLFCFVYRSLAIPQFCILPPTDVMHNKEEEARSCSPRLPPITVGGGDSLHCLDLDFLSNP